MQTLPSDAHLATPDSRGSSVHSAPGSKALGQWPSLRVLGIDPGTLSTGVAVVAAGDELHHYTVLKMRASDVQARILACKAALTCIVQHWQPTAIAIERYVWEGHATSQHEFMCWLVGSMLDLGMLLTPVAPVRLYTVSEWRRQLIGRSKRSFRGAYSKQAAERVLSLRLGYASWERGLHDMDAAGVALVALDTLQSVLPRSC